MHILKCLPKLCIIFIQVSKQAVSDLVSRAIFLFVGANILFIPSKFLFYCSTFRFVWAAEEFYWAANLFYGTNER